MDGEAKILPRVLLYLLRHHEGLASEEEKKEGREGRGVGVSFVNG